MASFEASFDVTSLLTSLFTGGDWPPPERSFETRAWAAEAARHVKGWGDSVPLHQLPRLSPGQRRRLFHERVHYWQLMSLPLQQVEFILDLEQIKATAVRLSGRTPMISGMSYGSETMPAAEIAQHRNSVRANFVTPRFEDLTVFDPRSTTNLIPERDVAMPFVMFPWGSADDPELLPAYLALIYFRESDNAAFVPFSGRNLLESAAYLCERLREGKLPERLAPSCTSEDMTYTGAWEFWLRVHGDRYRSEKDLALGFLAAVDLAMCSDYDPDEIARKDADEQGVWTSIPYRFGKIAYRLQGQPPLIAKDSPEDAIAQFQAVFCRWCGLPAPDVIIRKAMARLTKCLALHMSTRTLDKHQDAVAAIAGLPDWELATRTAELEALWPVIARDMSHAPAIGHATLWAMLNALRLRLRHPGRFAAPHLYEDALAALFPLPLLSRDGLYYLDETPSTVPANNQDLRSDTVELVHDCLSLMTVSPLRHGTAECGFITKAAQCWYLHSGLGCPSLGLDARQAQLRRQTGLGDWCHWEQRRLRLRLQ
ncbi:MAG TPA: hypothetical protein VGS19_17430 [Streptosporangiaceae bacterium]|nr:hypothetical protein [Streptosporangiaceae bacterium]